MILLVNTGSFAFASLADTASSRIATMPPEYNLERQPIQEIAPAGGTFVLGGGTSSDDGDVKCWNTDNRGNWNEVICPYEIVIEVE